MVDPLCRLDRRRPIGPSWRHGVAAVLAIATLLVGCDEEPLTAQIISLRIIPERVDVGVVPVGLIGEATLVVSNGGNTAWVPDGPPVVDGEGFTWGGGCDDAVGPGSACQAVVRFAPTTLGPSSGTLVVRADGAGEGGADVVVEAELSAAGAEPVLVLDPPAIDFGTVTVGESARRTITARNVGDADLALTFTVGPETHFTVGGLAGGQLRVPAGGQQTLDVTFHPGRGGALDGRFTALLCGLDCGPTVDLAGEGSAPRLDASPRQLDLGFLAPGDVVSSTVTLQNTGVGALEIRGLEIVSADPGLSVEAAGSLPLVLGDGERTTLTIRYAPRQGRQALDSLLVIASNDPVSPQAFIPIDAAVEGAGFDLLPEALHYGRLLAGDSRAGNLVIRSVGGDDLDIDDIRLEGPFQFAIAPPTSALPAGQSLNVVVVATGTDATDVTGGATGALIVETNAGSRQAALTFQGGTSGCVPVARLAHANLGFVQLRTGSTADVFVRNEGDAPCQLADLDTTTGLPFDIAFDVDAVGLGSLQPGQTGTVRFSFLPTREGERTAIVAVTFRDVQSPLFVSASGTGIDGGLAFVPGSVIVGPLDRGCGDVVRTVTLANTAARPLLVESVGLSSAGPFALRPTRTPPFTLLPGATTPVEVTMRVGVASDGVTTGTGVAAGDGLEARLQLQVELANQGEAIEEDFVISGNSAVDILFVVDNSGSMFDDQELLAANFEAFFQDGLESTDVDFQVGVTTTDVISPDAAAGALVGSPSILRRSTSGLASAFAENVRVGVDGAGLELGLEAMRLALSIPENSGFLRRDAALSVVFVTDEQDAGAFPQDLDDPALARSPDEYVAFLEALKGASGDDGGILVSGALPPFGASRYEAVISAFGGIALDITEPDWGEQLSAIGADTFRLNRTLLLEGEPQGSSITVVVNGRESTAFTYDAQRNVVILDDDPGAGSQVRISYRSGC